MLLVIEDKTTKIVSYMVTNDQGLCLIYTTNSALAHFVNKHTKGIPPNVRLRIGGDPGTRKKDHVPIFHHVRNKQ